MRYKEIIEAKNNAEKMAADTERRRRANFDLNSARQNQTDASRKYQDTVRAGNDRRKASATYQNALKKTGEQMRRAQAKLAKRP